MMTNSNEQETVQQILAMCQQERKGYQTMDFLHQSTGGASSASMGPLHQNVDIDVDCRTKMTAWCYQVIDFCKFNRETVAIAMNLLDRYMLTPASAVAKSDRKTYQLAAMTCLYTAVKIHEPEAMDPKLISTLSRGTYQPHEVEAMELQILIAVAWRVNPPTAMAFVRKFLDLIPSNALSEFAAETIYDLAKFQAELVVSEYDFIATRPSVIGYCALLNAFETVGLANFSEISNAVSQAIDMESTDGDINLQSFLYQAILQEPTTRGIFRKASPAASKLAKPSLLARQASCEISPRSVSAA